MTWTESLVTVRRLRWHTETYRVGVDDDAALLDAFGAGYDAIIGGGPEGAPYELVYDEADEDTAPGSDTEVVDVQGLAGSPTAVTPGGKAG